MSIGDLEVEEVMSNSYKTHVQPSDCKKESSSLLPVTVWKILDTKVSVICIGSLRGEHLKQG